MNMIPTRAVETRTERQRFVLYGIGWRGFKKFQEAVGNTNYRMTYDRGNLEIMSPLPIHERFKHVFSCLFSMMALEIETFHVVALASTTLQREDLDRGVEPDECYYVTTPVTIRGREHLDLMENGPPDLAIEVDVTSSVLDRMGVYAGLGVSEIWRMAARLEVYRLDEQRAYQVHPEGSVLFPQLPMAEVEEVVRAAADIFVEGQLMRGLRKWVRERLLPRWQAGQSSAND